MHAHWALALCGLCLENLLAGPLQVEVKLARLEVLLGVNYSDTVGADFLSLSLSFSLSLCWCGFHELTTFIVALRSRRKNSLMLKRNW